MMVIEWVWGVDYLLELGGCHIVLWHLKVDVVF